MVRLIGQEDVVRKGLREMMILQENKNATIDIKEVSITQNAPTNLSHQESLQCLSCDCYGLCMNL